MLVGGRRALSDSYAIRSWPRQTKNDHFGNVHDQTHNLFPQTGIHSTSQKATAVYFDRRLKSPLEELNKAGFPSNKKERLASKIECLKALEFPVSEKNILKELFHKIFAIKKKHSESAIRLRPATYAFTLNEEPCEVDIYPFFDDSTPGAAGKIRHEAVVSFVFPQTDELDNTKHIQCGSSKQIGYGWLIGKQPKRIVRAVTHFQLPNPEEYDSQTCTDYYLSQTKSAHNEATYLNRFQGYDGFPEAYKCFNLKDKNILLMKYYHSDLFTELGRGKLVDDYKKIQTVIDVFSRLSTMHKQGISHQDIKLENFLLDETDTPIVCDFGFCCEPQDNQEKFNVAAGTLQCMPWEKLDNYFHLSALSPEEMLAADVWSAGQVALAVLWNEPIPSINVRIKAMDTPFDPAKKHLIDKRLQLVKAQMEALSNHEPGTHDLLTHLIWETMHIEPMKRPSADEVVRRLTSIQKSYSPQRRTFTIAQKNDYWVNLLAQDVFQPTDGDSSDSFESQSETAYSPMHLGSCVSDYSSQTKTPSSFSHSESSEGFYRS